MKTDQERFEEFWETNKYSVHAGVSISKDTVHQIYNIALASHPTKWHDWSKEKPVVENEFGAISVILEWIGANGIRDYSGAPVQKALDDSTWMYKPIAWYYILPSSFSVKPKSKAEVAWENWHSIKEYDSNDRVSKENFLSIYELGQKAEEK